MISNDWGALPANLSYTVVPASSLPVDSRHGSMVIIAAHTVPSC